MVLGISLRRRKTKEAPVIRPSPSLPNIAATGLSTQDWPQDWVDIASIKQDVIANADVGPSEAHRKSITLQSAGHAVRSFHRPFRPADLQTSASADPSHGRKSIASIYSSPPSAFSNPVGGLLQKVPSLRKIVRVPPKFNVLVAGAQGTGKTSFVKLFLSTCDISPTALDSDIAAIKAYCETPTRHTKALKTLAVEVCEERHERVQLTVIDTPGFDFESGHELDLERGISSVVRYLDAQFAETMGEESKVIRQNKGDKHVHLCIYLVDPDSIMRPTARKQELLLPPSAALHHRQTSLSSITSTETSESSSEDERDSGVPGGELKVKKSIPQTMDPAELEVIKRLAVRCNVLPIIARADTLSDARLALVRQVVRRDLIAAGLGFGIFDPGAAADAKPPAKVPSTPVRQVRLATGTPPVPSPTGDEPEEDSEEERTSRPVIKLKSPRTPSARERSRSRRRMLDLEDEEEPTNEGPVDRPPTSWPRHSKEDVASMMPFTVIAPEEAPKARRRRAKSDAGHTAPNGAPATEDAAEMKRRTSVKDLKQYIRGPADFQGQFIRRYRWGTIDVLNPSHCDFVALRTAVLGTHLRPLKNNTKEVLYENYRTEKLLARRATRNITDADRSKLLKELGV